MSHAQKQSSVAGVAAGIADDQLTQVGHGGNQAVSESLGQ